MSIKLKIRDKTIGKGYPTFLIAEMACAHQGSVLKAMALVHKADKAKADAIQLQIFKKELYISPRHKDYDIVSKIELSQEDWEKVINEIQKTNLLFFSSGYDIESVKFLIKNDVDAFKIHSSDISNMNLIKEIGESRKPVFLSCGASSLTEISMAIKVLKYYGTKEIVLMWGFQAYPTKIEDIHLMYIRTLERVFKLNVGFYDHVDGSSILSKIIPIMSIGYGAQVIEKHFTLNREGKGIDYESSLNPDEFLEFQKLLRESEKAINYVSYHQFTKDEEKYRNNVKKSLVYNKDLKKGEIIDISILRSYELGISPLEFDKIVNKKLKRDVKKYDNIEWEDFK